MNEETHLFLSDAWIEAARALREEYRDRLPPPPLAVRANIVITDSPHHDGEVHGHIDTSTGQVLIERGSVDDATVTVTTDYETAYTTFISRDPQESMSAFLSGKILLEGDASQIMLIQAQPPSPDALELYERLEAITSR